jgi:hypothetical protein
MNIIEANGGNATQREIAVNVVKYCIKKLMPRMRTLNIEIQLRYIKCDAIGYCMMTDNNRTFEIEIDKKQSIKDLVTTICHEMVHVKQYAKNQMDDGIRSGAARWKNRTVSFDTEYYDLPWEKEAYAMQENLANSVWKNSVI